MAPFKLVVFDLDGTLVETAPDLAAAMNHLLRGLGRREVDPLSVRLMVGRGARVLMQKAMADTGPAASEQELDGLVSEFLGVYETLIASQSLPFERVEDALDRLAARNVISAICTNKPEHLSEILLDALGLRTRFSSLIGGDTLDVRKPNARPLLEAISRAGSVPDNTVMVGDSITDIQTARAAGVPVIGVSFGYTDTPMSELGADIVIDHFDELDAALETLRHGH